MEPQEYPVRHFESMVALAKQLQALPAQVLEHQYSYDAFGSWCLVIRFKGLPVRLAFDGRDRRVTVARSTSKKPPFQWADVTSWTMNNRDSAADARELCKAIVDSSQAV